MSRRWASPLLVAPVSLVLLGWFMVPSSLPAPEAQFAPDGGPRAQGPTGFDANAALGYIGDLCRIGPRISGTAGMRRQQELLIKHFEAAGGKVTPQRFAIRQRSRTDSTEMTNLVISSAAGASSSAPTMTRDPSPIRNPTGAAGTMNS